MPRTRKRTTRKRTTKRPTKRATAIKNLKQKAKAAVKAGLTPGQIAGIAVGGTAVAGLGTAAGVMALRDSVDYQKYKENYFRAQAKGIDYKPNMYEQMRGFPERHEREHERLDTDLTVSDALRNFKNFRRKETSTDRGKHRQNMSSIFDSIKAARPSIDARYKRDEYKQYGYGLPDLKYGKRRRRKRRKKRSFGKKVKKPSAALRRMCKRLKVRLTLKRGKKRVYKSEKVLKKQCKKAKRRKRKK